VFWWIKSEERNQVRSGDSFSIFVPAAKLGFVSNTNGASCQRGCRRSVTTCAFPFIPKRWS
jgi:hypothetical protein